MSFKIVVDATPTAKVMVSMSDDDTAFSCTLSPEEAEQFAYLLISRAQSAREPEESFMEKLNRED